MITFQKQQYRKNFFVSLTVLFLLLIFLSLGFNPAAVAITLACLLILAGATKPRRALEKVN